MEQGGVVLSYAKNPAGAKQFGQLLVSPQGKTVLKQYGFGLPN
jgi:ABC-type molybdate transport system substrate-binding protein